MSKTTAHKEGKATVRVVYYTSKTLSDGSHPFMLCVTKDRKRKYIATGYSLLPKYWNGKAKSDAARIRSSYPGDAKDLWRKLDAKAVAYEKAAEDLAEADEQHDTETILRKATEARKAGRRVKLLAYIEELAAGMAAVGQIGNAGVYRDLGNQLAKFIGDEANAPEPPLGKGQEEEKAAWVQQYDVPFSRLTVSFCNEWEATLRATGIEEITLSLRFRTLRAVLNKAIANGFAKPEHYPFARNTAEKHKFSVGKFDISTQKRAISRDELRKLEALQTTSDRAQLAKDVFLFIFFCGGINFVDLAQLRWSNLNGPADAQRLTYVRQKTGGKFNMKLLAPAAAILESYRAFTYASPSSYIFPVLDQTKHLSPMQIKNRLHKVLGQVNADLKALGQQAGIATPLTTYVARHSMATVLRKSGASTAVISQAMGHSSEAVTAIYLESFAAEVVDDTFDALL
ncbi:site-specific integrase [Hymenobacter chitinivorans]|uniref:Phage integrase family protein n=1 Tax=Hymenobacter chitinivorans DSM 11115 TaxID=1121954 RepID=A0A2M9B9G9_9BACT|nr:site-specific integrase [Hymenobacter chitinivorans]PJJ54601.1 phage integrase family protein [Hymenobacter chitinivorans DSM 11115]